jgi:hypothetical protein
LRSDTSRLAASIGTDAVPIGRGQAAQWVESTGDQAWLERGLAAAGLENRAIDYRDTLVGLTALWRAAERAGLDAEKVWHLVAPGEERARGRQP